MYFYKINTYECIKKPKVVSTLSIDNWFNQIKQSDYSERILKARNGALDYATTKAQMPCVTYNFLFDDYKNDTNISSSTGLIYIDIDNSLFNINDLDLSKVYSYYKSFGGNGYAIIVKVTGLTQSNFHATYTNITDELGISKYIDKQAIKASQFNVLSYDKDIFINKDSHSFSSIETATPSIVIRKKEEAYTIEGRAEYKSIRFDDLDKVEIKNESYVVNWVGYKYIKCFIPIKKVVTNRNAFLLSYCNNLVYLNQDISIERTMKILNNVNFVGCSEPVDDQQIRRIVNSIHKYLNDGSLESIYFWKTRKIVFDKLCGFNRDEKLEICRLEIAKKKTSDSKNKLYSILESWDFKKYGKVSQRKIYKNHPISKKTVEKYWCDFKSFTEFLNKIIGKELE